MSIKIIGGNRHDKFITHYIIDWCVDHFNLDSGIDINMSLKLGIYTDRHYGTCIDNDDGGYDITVCTNQSLRDFVATIVHEMVHVKQYVTGKWKGTGEREANKLQYKLADRIWKENVI
jgi:hypothetical protein